MSTYENEPIPTNRVSIGLDDLGCFRPQEICQPTIYASRMKTKITSRNVDDFLVSTKYAPHIFQK